MTCNCIAEINADLRDQHNAVLISTLFGEQKAVIYSEKLDSKKRGKPPLMIASFCPFCGSKYGEKSPLPAPPQADGGEG